MLNNCNACPSMVFGFTSICVKNNYLLNQRVIYYLMYLPIERRREKKKGSTKLFLKRKHIWQRRLQQLATKFQEERKKHFVYTYTRRKPINFFLDYVGGAKESQFFPSFTLLALRKSALKKRGAGLFLFYACVALILFA